MSYTVGQRIRYLGPYDECAGHGPHPYGGMVGVIVALATEPPLPPQPITIRFPDGMVVRAMESEVREPSQLH